MDLSRQFFFLPFIIAAQVPGSSPAWRSIVQYIRVILMLSPPVILILVDVWITQKRCNCRGAFVGGASMSLFILAWQLIYRSVFPAGSRIAEWFFYMRVSNCVVEALTIIVFCVSLGIAVCWFRKPDIERPGDSQNDYRATIESTETSF